jgi:hypothetical protein
MTWPNSSDESNDDDRELPDPSDMDQDDDDGVPDGAEPCPNCRQYIYEDSAFCPHCGYAPGPNFWSRKPVWIVFTVIVCLAVVALYWVL